MRIKNTSVLYPVVVHNSMNQYFKILLIGIGMSICSFGLTFIFYSFVLTNLGDWTMSITQKYLIFNLNPIDNSLFQWFPVIIALVHISFRIKEIKIYFKTLLWTLCSLLTMFFIGVAIALLTWTNEGSESPLLPDYLKYQPNTYYWTIFLFLGILVSVLFLFLKQGNRLSQNKNNS